MKIACIQLNPTVGAIENNINAIIERGLEAQRNGAELIVFPEMVVTGYPPEDLIERKDVQEWVASGLQRIKEQVANSCWVVGHSHQVANGVANAASIIIDGEIVATYEKQELPNYDVFDDFRNFKQGSQPFEFEYKGQSIAVLICEDLWHQDTVAASISAKTDMIVSLNASPFELDKLARRRELVGQIANQFNVSVLYCNLVGGQDDLVFDGCSLFAAPNRNVKAVGAAFEESDVYFDSANQEMLASIEQELLSQWPTCEEGWIYQTLVTGTRDYVHKNGFKGALLGLSGGIDSALTLCIAADAIGPENIRAVMMPYKYTAQMSVEDAKLQALNLGVKFDIISIQDSVESFLSMLAPVFEGTKKDTTEENLQARTRGVTLMAMSNKFGSIVLTTGNKSEMAVGYATLYGDMAGGYAVLKDVLKTKVYSISKFVNRHQEIIPDRVITRPPSAELAPDQVDQDSLPDYDVLDRIIQGYVEQDASFSELVEAGIEPDVLARIQRLIDINEYKRRQSAPGPKVSPRAFGRERRYPITSGLKQHYTTG